MTPPLSTIYSRLRSWHLFFRRRYCEGYYDIGIRLALGAPHTNVFRLVLRQGMALVAVGCAIGLLLAATVCSFLASFLFGLPPFDPVTFVGAATLFGFTGLVACYAPARRATKVDPLVALRCE